MGDQAVQVDVIRSLEAKVLSANVVDSLVINHERTVGVLKGSVGGQDGVIWLDDRGSGLWCWVDTELQLYFLSVIDRQTLHKKSTETRSSSTTEGMENEEPLKTRAVIGNPANLIQYLINQLLANSVMSTSVVV